MCSLIGRAGTVFSASAASGGEAARAAVTARSGCMAAVADHYYACPATPGQESTGEARAGAR